MRLKTIILIGIFALIVCIACGPSEEKKEIPPAGQAQPAKLDLPHAWAGWPALSADGNYLVYAGGDDAKTALVYCYDVANHRPYRPVSPEGVEGCRWIKIANPSALIAYIAGDEDSALVRVDSYLGGSTRVADSSGFAGELFFGYDNKRICWISQKPGEKFRTVRYTATTQSQVVSWKARSFDVLHPSININGGLVTYTLADPAGPELHLADYGGGADRLLDKGALEYGQGAFSPNESTIVFTAKYPGTSATDLYKIPLEGGEAIALTKFDVIGRVSHPVISPDGNYVYFLFSAPSSAAKSGLWRVGLAGGEPEQAVSAPVNPEMPLSMSESGTKVVFAVGDGNKSEIWLVEIKGAPPVYAF